VAGTAASHRFQVFAPESSLILVKREGGWRITHGHNTVVDPNAQPFDPVNDGWNGQR
jgi:hypothetical protein